MSLNGSLEFILFALKPDSSCLIGHKGSSMLSQAQFSEHDVYCHAHVGTTSLKVFTLRCLLGFGTTHALLFYCLINDHIIFSSLIMSTALDPLSRKIKEV